LSPEQLAALSDRDATACVTAERAFVHALGASCNTPVGAHAQLRTPDEVELIVWAGLPDGGEWISDRAAGAPSEVGATVAERMLAAGADELLARAERQVQA
jgi:hydroxymethylbilane synthase